MIGAVSQRYVEALFRLAKQQGELERVRADVERLGREFATPAVARFLLDARIPLAERRAKVSAPLAAAHPLVANFVNLVLERKREGVLPDLAKAFHQRWLVEKGAVEGVVESARALSPGDIEALAQALGKRLGKTVHLQNQIDPSLVGGVRVFVDNRLLDASVQGRLEGLRKRMLEAELPGART